MRLKERLQREREFHESEDKARNENSLIRRVYSSGIFDEANFYYLNAVGDIRDVRVLEFGCGGGWDTAKLRALGARMTAFDISRTRLMEAQSHLSVPGAGHAVGLVQCAGEALPFADESFDAILGKGILHHLDLDAAVPEIRRVLRPGGKAVFLEPLVHNPILESYRRLTPHLRSPTERALSAEDMKRIGRCFTKWAHREFCLLAVLPVLADALIFRRLTLARYLPWLRRLDSTLLQLVPPIWRYYWETVMVLEK